MSGPRGAAPYAAGLFTGALIGASLAMILAPASGEDTRDLLRLKAKEAAGRARAAAGRDDPNQERVESAGI